ncbi:hypothetical protein OAK19_02385 [Aureispira]|nr:hypothetical protein [Aureispira sp.]
MTYFKFDSNDVYEPFWSTSLTSKAIPQQLLQNGTASLTPPTYQMHPVQNTGMSLMPPPQAAVAPRQVGMTRGLARHNGTTQGSAEYYTVPGTYQANLSPRIMSQGFGANIKYNAPPESLMALKAKNPMMLANQVEKQNLRENFVYDVGSGPSLQQRQTAQLSGNSIGDSIPALPAPTMNNSFADSNGQNAINMTRFMWSNSYRREQGQGDMIRGDIPVNPSCLTSKKYFVPAAANTPSQVLQGGAMFAMGGVGNGTPQQTAMLSMQAAGGSFNAIGGTTVNVPMTTPLYKLVNPTATTLGRTTDEQLLQGNSAIAVAFP